MRVLIEIASALLLALWCGVAYAATQTFGNELGKIPLGAYLWVLGLAIIPGVYNVLAKIEQGIIKPGPRAWITVVRELMGSVIAGFAAFFAAEASKSVGVPMPEWAEALSIGLAGWAGARYIEALIAKRNGGSGAAPAPERG